MLANLRQTKIMPWPAEVTNLLFPLFLLALVALAAAFGPETLSGHYSYLFLVSNILLFNLGHTGLSLCVLRMPEGRAFLQKTSRMEIAGILAFGLISLLLFLAAMTSTWGKQSFLYGVNLKDFAFFFLKIYGSWHIIFQIRGISLVYDQVSREQKNPRSEGLQRKLFYLLFGLIFVGAALPFLSVTQRSLNWSESGGKITLSLFLFALLTAFTIIWNQARTLSLNKTIFFLRLLILPFYLISPLAVFAAQAVHGVESICFFQRMQEKSSRSQRSAWPWIGVVGIVSLLGLPFLFRLPPHTTDFGYGPTALVLNSIIAFSFAIPLLHFYIDSRIYRMKNAVVRETIGRLLS